MRNAVAFLYIAGMVVAPFAANAASVTYDFTGTVTEALGDYGSVALGSTVTGTYTFNLGNGVPTLIGGPGESQGTVGSTTANWTAANNGGSYYVATPSSAYVFSSTANFSGFSYNTGAPGAYQDSTYVSGSLAVSPSYTFEASEKEAPTSGTSTGSSFFLEGSSPEWGSDGLPLSISSANPNNFGFIEIQTPSGGYATQLEYEITSLTPVPLPATAWLLLSGLGGGGAFARKRALRRLYESSSGEINGIK